MKDPWLWVLVLIFLALIATCAQGCNSTEPETCEMRQYKAIKVEWRNYEVRTGAKIVFPDWRRDAWKWAQAECDMGFAIRSFRP